MKPTRQPEPLASRAPKKADTRARRRIPLGLGRALAGTLGAIGERLIGREPAPEAAAGAGKRRLEEVLERDRALCEPAQHAEVPAAEVRPEVPAAEVRASVRTSAAQREVDDGSPAFEPIRTRTMARLLAAQGYTKRALAIYEELALREPHDAELIARIAALRT